jgi:putative Holliday junction resolvase
MRTGRRLAFDYGDVRIGVAVSDPDGIFASPREHVINDEHLVKSLEFLISETEPIYLVVGLPLHLHGGASAKSKAVQSFAAQLRAITPLEIFFVDERLSTVSAAKSLRDSGKNTRESKGLIDSAAAAGILESALLSEKSQGVPSRLTYEDK